MQTVSKIQHVCRCCAACGPGIALLLLLLAAPATYACESSDPRRVIDLFSNNDFSAARTHLDQWARRGAGADELAFYRALVVLARARHSAGKQRERLTQQALQQLLGFVTDYSNSTDKLNIGMAKALAARIYLDQERWFKAYRLGRAARDELRALVKREPEREDAWFVLGLYEFYTGSVPAGLKWLMALLDLSGDREKGLRYLERAVTHAPVAAPEAARVLVYELPLEAPQVCAYIPLLKEMRKRYAQNLLLTLRLQRLYRNCGHPLLALAENRQAGESPRSGHWFKRKLDWEALHIYRDLGNPDAIESLRGRFRHRPQVWLRAKAGALDVLGKYRQAGLIYRQLDTAENQEDDFGNVVKLPRFKPPSRVMNDRDISLGGCP